VASRTATELPELSLEGANARAPARRRRSRRIARLIAVLAAVSALYFYLHPGDWQFWRRAVAEARRSRIVEEVRGWWARLVVESPGELSPPVTTATSATPPAVTAPSVPSPAAVASAEPRPASPPVESPAPREDAQRQAQAAQPAPAKEAPVISAPAVRPPAAEAPGHLDIEFEHHLRHGNLQVWVDDVGVVDEDFDGRVTKKILAIELRKGVVQQQLTLSPGPHDVRVQVRWDDNVKSARISGRFRPGTSRRLEVQVGRLRGNLSLAWK
jgi:hypothetical protein